MSISPFFYYLIPMGIARIGVPFFLITTGYFFYERLSAKREYKTVILKYFRLWIIFTVIELLIAGKYFYPKFGSPFLFIRQTIMVGLGDAYWYLWTVPVTLLILIPLWGKKRFTFSLITGLVLFLLSMVNDSYSFVFDGTLIQKIVKLHQKVFIWTGAGFVTTILFLSVGAWINEHRNSLDVFFENHRLSVIICAVTSVILVLIESEITCSLGCNDSMNKISLLSATPLLFIIVLKYESDNQFFNYLGSLSLNIYTVHPLVNDITKMLGWNSVVSFIFTAVVSIVVSSLIRFFR